MGNSLIFNSPLSQNLTATGKVGINPQKFTFSTFFKASGAAAMSLYDFSDGTAANRVQINLSAAGLLTFNCVTGNAVICQLVTTAAFNDGNWHHLLVGADTTQAVNTNRLAMAVDGSVPSFGSVTYPPLNTNLSNNFASIYDIGSRQAVQFLNGSLAQVYYIDGQLLPASSFFGGVNQPIPYTGAYTGVFDFFLPFSNGTSLATLGADASGEGNNWTLNNMSLSNQSTDYPAPLALGGVLGSFSSEW